AKKRQFRHLPKKLQLKKKQNLINFVIQYGMFKILHRKKIPTKFPKLRPSGLFSAPYLKEQPQKLSGSRRKKKTVSG
ncbi:MAG: hypothetical protein ACOX7J_08450, partial [Bacillota bacterium]